MRRALARTFRVIAIGGAATVAAVIAACGPAGGTTIAQDLAEGSLTNGLTVKGLPIAKVTCPANVAARPGEKFTCTATRSDGGDEVPVDVTVTDDKGNVSWALRGVVVHEKLMGEGIAAKIHPITVDCPDKVVVIPVGQSFMCGAGSNHSALKMEITVADADGNVTWKLIP